MPRGRHFAVTWSIPDDFGGMTATMLQRSRAFRRLTGTEVTVLTFDDRLDTAGVESGLRERGALIDGVRLLNLYDWLREHALPGGSLRLDRHVFTPLDPHDPALTTARLGDAVLQRTRHGDDGSILQVDHYRTDGTLLLSDRRDAKHRGVAGGRSVVLCDSSGEPVRSWRSIRFLYVAWLDALTADERSFMIVDSKTTARFMADYRRDHVVTVHLVHNSHLEPGSHLEKGGRGLVPERREVFGRLQDFDAVALLTKAQRREVRQLVGRMPRLVVVPNAYHAVTAVPADDAGRSGGIVTSRLTEAKRVDHAIAAVQLANQGLDVPVRLDIYGDGPERARLEELAAEDPNVRLHGYDPDARGQLARASFQLGTGRSEGFSLAIVDAMAAGCIPIVYDVRYGPAEIISHGRGGRLIRDGDVPAMAAAVREVATATPEQLARIRAAARRRARDFSEERVTGIWVRTLRRTWRHKDRTRRRALARKNARRVARGLKRRVRAIVARWRRT